MSSHSMYSSITESPAAGSRAGKVWTVMRGVSSSSVKAYQSVSMGVFPSLETSASSTHSSPMSRGRSVNA